MSYIVSTDKHDVRRDMIVINKQTQLSIILIAVIRNEPIVGNDI